MTAEHSPATPSEIAQAKEAEERAKRIRPPTAEDVERLKARAVEIGLLLPLSFVPQDAQAKEAEYARKLEAMPPIYVPVSEWLWEMYLREADEAQNAAPVKS